MEKRNWLALFGYVYVLVWVIGLAIPTGTLSPAMSNAELQDVLVAHQQARMVQVYLIDGIAGVSIFLFAAAAAGLLRPLKAINRSLADVVLGAGIAAGSISLVQAGVQLTLIHTELLASPESPFRVLLVLVNQIDAFKLMALALLGISTSILGFRTLHIPVWINWFGAVLAAALILGGLSFIIANAMLSAVLFASLPMLLVWVAAVSSVIMTKSRNF